MKPSPADHPNLPHDTTWMAWGDLALLDAPRLEPVILSRSLTPQALADRLAELETAVREGAVLVGGFISHGETEAAKRLARLPELRLVRLLPYPMALCHPGAGALRRIEDGHTLILSGFPEGDGRLTRSACVQVNRWVLALCGQHADSPAEALHEAKPTEDDPGAIFL